MYLTEQQRLEAIKACDRIQELCEQQQQSFQRIIEIFDRLSKPETYRQRDAEKGT